MKQNSKELSIVILNWNGIRHLPDCLESIRDQTINNFEVLIVDNGSKDGSCDFIKRNYPDFRLTENEVNLGYCKAANQGIKAATGEFVLLLNNDTKLRENYVEYLLACWKKQSRDVIGIFPVAVFFDNPEIINSAGVNWTRFGFWQPIMDHLDFEKFSSESLDRGIHVFGDRFIAPCFRRDLLKAIGGFDEIFFSYGEDVDVCYRANILGYKFMLCPKVQLQHKMSQSLVGKKSSIPHFRIRYGLRNYLFVILKNYEWHNILFYILPFSFRVLLYGGIIKYLNQLGVHYIFRIIISFFEGMFDVILHVPHLLKQRAIIQSLRRKKDVEIWNIRFTTNNPEDQN